MLAGLEQNYIYSLYLITHQKSLSSLSSLLSHRSTFLQTAVSDSLCPLLLGLFFQSIFFASYAKESFAEYSSVF